MQKKAVKSVVNVPARRSSDVEVADTLSMDEFSPVLDSKLSQLLTEDTGDLASDIQVRAAVQSVLQREGAPLFKQARQEIRQVTHVKQRNPVQMTPGRAVPSKPQVMTMETQTGFSNVMAEEPKVKYITPSNMKDSSTQLSARPAGNNHKADATGKDVTPPSTKGSSTQVHAKPAESRIVQIPRRTREDKCQHGVCQPVVEREETVTEYGEGRQKTTAERIYCVKCWKCEESEESEDSDSDWDF